MPDPKQILQDPDFKSLSVGDRRSIIDSLLDKDTDFSSLQGQEKIRLKSDLYSKYGSENGSSLNGQSQISPPTAPAQTGASTAYRQSAGQKSSRLEKNLSNGSNKPTTQVTGTAEGGIGAQLGSASVTPQKPSADREAVAAYAHVDPAKMTPLQEQAARIRMQNQQGNIAHGEEQQRGLLAPYHAVAEPLSHLLSMGIRGITEANKKAFGQQLSPLQQEINKQQAGLNPLQRSYQEDPRGFGVAVDPESYRKLEVPSKTPIEAIGKAAARGVLGMTTVDNAVIGAALGPLATAGTTGKIASMLVTGYFGSMAAGAAKDGFVKYQQSGGKDNDALADAIVNSAFLGLVASHGFKEANGIRTEALKTSQPVEYMTKALAEKSGIAPERRPIRDLKGKAIDVVDTDRARDEVAVQETQAKPKGRAQKAVQPADQPTPTDTAPTPEVAPKANVVPGTGKSKVDLSKVPATVPPEVVEAAKPKTTSIAKTARVAKTEIEQKNATAQAEVQAQYDKVANELKDKQSGNSETQATEQAVPETGKAKRSKAGSDTGAAAKPTDQAKAVPKGEVTPDRAAQDASDQQLKDNNAWALKAIDLSEERGRIERGPLGRTAEQKQEYAAKLASVNQRINDHIATAPNPPEAQGPDGHALIQKAISTFGIERSPDKVAWVTPGGKAIAKGGIGEHYHEAGTILGVDTSADQFAVRDRSKVTRKLMEDTGMVRYAKSPDGQITGIEFHKPLTEDQIKTIVSLHRKGTDIMAEGTNGGWTHHNSATNATGLDARRVLESVNKAITDNVEPGKASSYDLEETNKAVEKKKIDYDNSVKELAAKGKSDVEIAKELGETTTSGVLGAKKRLGIKAESATVAPAEQTAGFKSRLGPDGKLDLDKVQKEYYRKGTTADHFMNYVEHGDEQSQAKVREFAEKKLKFAPHEVDELVKRMDQERGFVQDQERDAKKGDAATAKAATPVLERGKQAQETKAKESTPKQASAPASSSWIERQAPANREFIKWIDDQPKSKAGVYKKASALYEAYKKEHPNVTREQFGQRMRLFALSPEHEVVTPSAKVKAGDVFTFKDSTGKEVRVTGVRPAKSATVAPKAEVKPDIEEGRIALHSGIDPAAALKAADTLDIPSFKVERKPKDAGALERFRSPLSIVDAFGRSLQKGYYERIAGPLGKSISQVMRGTQQRIEENSSRWNNVIDAIEQRINTTAGKDKLSKERAAANFVDLIEKDFKDPTRKSDNPQIEQALKDHDSLTKEFRDYIIQQRKGMGIEMPDDWGITEKGYFRHLFLGDFIIKDADGAVVGYAGNYSEAQKVALKYLDEHKDAKLTASARQVASGDSTIRVPDGRYWKTISGITDRVNESGAVELTMRDIMDDVNGTIGRASQKTKFLGALEHRTNVEGYSKKYADVMKLHAYQVANSIEMSKLNRQIVPMVKALKAAGLPGLAEHVEDHVKALWSTPTHFERDIGRLVEKVPILRNITGNPALFMRWAVNKVTSAQSFLKLDLSPKGAFVNLIQPLGTLWPYISTKDFAGLYKDYMKPSTRQMLRDKGVFEGATKLEGASTRQGAKLISPFRAASQINRGIGYLYGMKQAAREGLPPEIQHLNGQAWAEKVEFDSSKWNAPPILRTPGGRLLGQFKGYTVKSIETMGDIGSATSEAGTSGRAARIAKATTAQIASGGIKSAGIPIKLLGGYLVYKGMEDQFNKVFNKDVSERMAKAIFYGAPSLIGVDLSASIAVLDEPYGTSMRDKIVNFFGGPSVDAAAKLGEGLWKYFHTKDDKEPEFNMRGSGASLLGSDKKYLKVNEKRLDQVAKLLKYMSPAGNITEGVMQRVLKQPPTVTVEGSKKIPITPLEAALRDLGFTPMTKAKYYDEKTIDQPPKEKSLLPRALR